MNRYYRALKFARQLERENAAMREVIKEAHAHIDERNDRMFDGQDPISNETLAKLQPYLP